jgi:GT2 family glycosyltransferase
VKKLAPVVLFVYNRPVHTRKTVESLLVNREAEHSDLLIFSDAPQNSADDENVGLVRNYIKKVSGFKSITIKEQTQNQGLAKSIIGGITEVINKFGKVIALEDDIETSPYFLKFMNDALNVYENEKKVWIVSGYNYPMTSKNLPETFFIKFAPSWGWATWIDRWEKYERNTDELLMAFTPKMKKTFNIGKGNYCFGQLEANKAGKMDTWLVYWYAKMFLSNGLCLFPRNSYAKNIGIDGTGVNCVSSEFYDVDLSDSYPIEFNMLISENKLARKCLAETIKTDNYFMQILSRLLLRIKRRGLFGALNFYFVKYVKRKKCPNCQ